MQRLLIIYFAKVCPPPLFFNVLHSIGVVASVLSESIHHLNRSHQLNVNHLWSMQHIWKFAESQTLILLNIK